MALLDGVSGLLSRAGSTRLRNPFRRDVGYLVIDIGSSSVKLVEVQPGARGPRLVRVGTTPVPADVIQSNVIQDQGEIVDAIRRLIAEVGAQAQRVVTAVPGPAVIVKKIVLPAQDGDALETAVLAEARHLIPDSLDNVNLDYQIIDVLEDGHKVELIVVAVKREIINSYTDAIRAAGLEPVVVDVDYFALENMFELNYDLPEGKPVALVNVGARYSSINILKDGRSTFTGDVPVGGAEYNDALVRQLGVQLEDAERVKLGHRLKGMDPQTVEGVLGSVTEFIVEELQRAISFFWTAATEEPLGGVFLSGGSARVPGLATQLSQRLECPVEVADPLRRVEVDRSVPRQLIEASSSALAVAVGLATRQPGDK